MCGIVYAPMNASAYILTPGHFVADENQRRIAVFGLGGKFCASSLLLTDRPPWSNHDGSKNYAQGLASPGLLPRGGKWSGEWVAGIWVHAFNFSHLGLRAKTQVGTPLHCADARLCPWDTGAVGRCRACTQAIQCIRCISLRRCHGRLGVSME
jgi:hypothetical protein